MAARGEGRDHGFQFLYRTAAGVLALMMATTALPHRTAAQEQPPPSRIANIWNHKDHQPTRSGVRSAERAAGLAMPSERKAQMDDELQRLYHQLLGEELNAGAH